MPVVGTTAGKQCHLVCPRYIKVGAYLHDSSLYLKTYNQYFRENSLQESVMIWLEYWPMSGDFRDGLSHNTNATLS